MADISTLNRSELRVPIDRDKTTQLVPARPIVVALPVTAPPRDIRYGAQSGSIKASSIPRAANAVRVEIRSVIVLSASAVGTGKVADVSVFDHGASSFGTGRARSLDHSNRYLVGRNAIRNHL
jgi:hypothetical protein